MSTSRIAAIAIIALVGSASPGAAAPQQAGAMPARVGACAFTTVTLVSQRLEDWRTHRVVPNTGSAVKLANGVYGVSYEQVPAVNESRPGDRVMTCLVKLPTHCPPGDRRGRLYTTTNLRTVRSWTLYDAEHMCGGA